MTGTMTCRDGVRVLMDYTEGLLTASRRRTVEKHVDGCRRCQGFVRSYVATPRVLRLATRTRMPATASKRLHQVIAKLPARGGRREPR